jgi:hypothetical protein
MALINLQTDLKSLKYGKDQFGGGSSNQPYIQPNIPASGDAPLVDPFFALDGGIGAKFSSGGFSGIGLTNPDIDLKFPSAGTGGPDFLVRGGKLLPRIIAYDVARLTKYLFDLKSPRGLLFIAKQNLLSKTAVRTQTSDGILNDGIYTPLSTLAQAGVSAFGLHLNKQGLNPFSETGAYATNNEDLYGVRVTPTQKLTQNRLAELHRLVVDKNRSINNWNFSGTDLNVDNDILRYPGGPGAILGIGKTHIRFADQRTGFQNINLKESGFFVPIVEDDSFYATKTVNQFNQVSVPVTRLKFSSKNIYLGRVKQKNTLEIPIPRIRKVPGSKLKTINQPISTGTLVNAEVIVGYSQDYTVFQRNLPSINGNTLLGLSRFSDLELPQYSGIDPSGSIDPNYRNIGSLDLPDSHFLQADDPILTTDKGYFTYTQTQINDIPDQPNGSLTNIPSHIGQFGITTPGDFRARLRTSTTQANTRKIGNLANAPDYTKQNIETRVNLGDPGNRNQKNLTSYVSGAYSAGSTPFGAASYNSFDTINYISLYNSAYNKGDAINDLVHFRIGVYNRSASSKVYVQFRAFLDQISDQYISDWDPVQYIGRGEKFYTYKGFDRKISLSWTVAAQSKVELIPMYEKLNYLASACAPNYSGNGYLGGNIVELTIGDYIKNQTGILTGFTYEMNDENATWEIGINDKTGNDFGADSTVGELPHLIKVTGFNFIPIHRFVPQTQEVTFDQNTGIVNAFGAEKYIWR